MRRARKIKFSVKLGKPIKTSFYEGPFKGSVWKHHERGATLEFSVVVAGVRWRGRYVDGRWVAVESANESRWVAQQFKEERTA